MEENIYEKIEAYLGGSMTPEEKEQFEEMMSQNPELQKEVQLTNEINHHLNENTWLNLEDTIAKRERQELDNYVNSNEAKAIKLKLKRATEKYKKNNNSLPPTEQQRE